MRSGENVAPARIQSPQGVHSSEGVNSHQRRNDLKRCFFGTSWRTVEATAVTLSCPFIPHLYNLNIYARIVKLNWNSIVIADIININY